MWFMIRIIAFYCNRKSTIMDVTLTLNVYHRLRGDAGSSYKKITCRKSVRNDRMKNSTRTETSSAIPPICSGGMTRRSALTGGSVMAKRGSAMIINQRGGLNCREKDWIISIIIRAINTHV